MGETALEFNEFRDTPYWLNFVWVSQAYTAVVLLEIAGGNTKYIQIKTPVFETKDGILCHINSRNMASSRENIRYKLWENVSLTDGSSEDSGNDFIEIDNLDRRVAGELIEPPQTEFLRAPTNIDLTGAERIEIGEVYVGTGVGGARTGANVNFSEFERVMKPNTDYLIEFENLGTGTTRVQVRWNFYESKS